MRLSVVMSSKYMLKKKLKACHYSFEMNLERVILCDKQLTDLYNLMIASKIIII